MGLSKLFHAVKSGTPEEKRAFWNLCKTAAVANGGNELIGLTKIALDIWADTYQSGGSPAADRATREAFSSSFGSAAAVERQFHKLAEAGELSEDELEKLSGWVAESAVNDLNELTKSANALLQPHVLGALTGAVMGAGIGAWRDKENRTRGAITGILPGAVMGATLTSKMPAGDAGNKKRASLSSKLADIMQGLDQGGQPPMNADAPEQEQPAEEEAPQGGEAIAPPDQGQAEAMEDVDRGHQVVDNMIFLAKQVQLPQLAQEMEQSREMLAGHFADGNAYLPPELQHHFAQSEHAEAFMKKYKQRFGAPTTNGSKKTANVAEHIYQAVDNLRGLAPGGVDMKELRKYLPDAQYVGMIPGYGGLQPGVVSDGGSRTMTWDPANVRHQRNADPEAFYRNLSRPLGTPEAFPAHQRLSEASKAQDQRLSEAYAPKTASVQDTWLSWRTHR